MIFYCGSKDHWYSMCPKNPGGKSGNGKGNLGKMDLVLERVANHQAPKEANQEVKEKTARMACRTSLEIIEDCLVKVKVARQEVRKVVTKAVEKGVVRLRRKPEH